MRVLVLSDNHHNWVAVENILRTENYDFSIHLGDAEVPERMVKLNFDKYVAGNHDFFSIQEDAFELEGIKFAILHGHTRGISVFSDLKPAARYGKFLGADVVLHGHTHVVSDKTLQGVRVLCPGSVAYPRSDWGCTYMILTLSNGEIQDVEWKKL